MKSQFVIFGCLVALSYSHAREIPKLLPNTIQEFLLKNNLGSRIVNGFNAEPGQFPHQVSLQVSIPKELPLSHFCGGSIISEQWILTAAHCVDAVENLEGQYKINFVVKAGKHNLRVTEDIEQVNFVEKRFKHEKWISDGQVHPYDVALLKLKTPLRLNERVSIIELPEKDSEPTGVTIVSGWGAITNDTLEQVMPKILQTVFNRIIPRDECNRAVEAVAAEEGQELKDAVHETNICTGPLDVGVSVCSGDSGGPLITYESPVELIGIVSWAMFPCGRLGAPSGVFVRVSSFIDWIENIINTN